jgi:hypothetical protein
MGYRLTSLPTVQNDSAPPDLLSDKLLDYSTSIDPSHHQLQVPKHIYRETDSEDFEALDHRKYSGQYLDELALNLIST